MMDNWQKGDEVWEVLGKARKTEVSPYFSRRVLAAIRTEPARPMIPVFLLRWLGGAALAVVTLGFFLSLEQPPAMALASGEFEEVFDAAAGLDQMVATTEFSIEQFATDL